MPTVGELLTAAALPLPEARALLAKVLQVPRERLIAFPEAAVAAPAAAAFEALAARRHAGEPLAYLRGEQEFYGRPFRVTRDVLVPRPDTETLVDVALECLQLLSAPRVLELGTGSGCIAITLQLERPDARVVATDVSTAALAVARGNAAERANELTGGKDPAILDTYARALFETGETEKAIQLQTKAVELAPEGQMQDELKDRLDEYQKKVKKG